MDQFKILQMALEEMYQTLDVFSELNWDDVAQEYITSHDKMPTDIDEFVINFPAYLEDKAHAGDAPDYLFELAYVELLQNQIVSTDIEKPKAFGIHLNPSLSFLNLSYDITQMLDDAADGNVKLIEREHILCLYRHPEMGPSQIEVTTEILEVLQQLEDKSFKSKNEMGLAHVPLIEELIHQGLILEVV